MGRRAVHPLDPALLIGESMRLKAGDVVREKGNPKAATWRITRVHDECYQLTGPGPCRSISYCDFNDVELVEESR